MSMCMKKCHAKKIFFFVQSDCLSNLAILYGLCILDSSFRQVSYSRQVFIYLDPILIYISLLNRLPIWNSQNCSMFPLAFVAGWLQGHWWGFISRNYVVWPTFLLMKVFIALKGSHFWFLFDFTAAGVVPCGGLKTSPCTSTIVQFIFYFGPLRSAIIFWESEISDWFRLIF